MAKDGLSSKQTLVVAICALMGALVLGTFLFLSDVGEYLMSTGR